MLLLIPAFIGLYVWERRNRRRKLKKFGNPVVLATLMRDVSPYKPAIKFTLLMCALTCLILAAARPWGGIVSSSSSKTGMEVVIAVDASNSMLATATDNPDDASRMTTAKIMLERLIDNMSNDRVGLVVFAGEAYQLIPASSDYGSAKSFLNSISPAEIPVQGTNIESAIQIARKTFTKEKEIGKAIVLLTDVEDLDDAQAAVKAVNDAHADGIQVNVVGVGSDNAVTIPYENGVFRDMTGEPVHTRLNAELGKELAKAGEGVYVNAAANDAIPMLQRQLRKSKQSAISVDTFSVHDELYIYFALAALLFLIAEACLTPGKNRWLSKVSFFKRGRTTGSIRRAGKAGVLLLTVVSATMLTSCVSDDYKASRNARKAIAAGNKDYEDENYNDAREHYDDALERMPHNATAMFNNALAHMRMAMALTDSARTKGLQEALQEFENLAAASTDPLVASQAYYNMGNMMLQEKQIPESIDLYKKALRINPADSLARRNLRIAQLNQQPQDKNNGGGGGQNNDKDKEKDKKKDNSNGNGQDKDKDKDKEKQQNPEQQPQQPQSPQQQPQQLSQGSSDRILQRSQNKENELRSRLYRQAAKQQQNRRHSIKNW